MDKQTLGEDEPKQLSDHLIIRTNDKWFNLIPPSTAQEKKDLNEFNLRKSAEVLLAKDVAKYRTQQKRSSKKSDFAWIRTVLTKGTIADKLAAHTILIQDSPVHNVNSISSLIQMVSPKSKRECLMAINNLKELFLGDLLLDRKLRPFSENLKYLNESDIKMKDKQLILFHFEDRLRQDYRQFLESLEKLSFDSVEATKSKAINTMYELLVANPEQEGFLLGKLVNKLGDQTPKLASHVAHLLGDLVNRHHSAMKAIVVGEIERLLYRPNVSEKAQYYALCFLTEIILNEGDSEVSNKLIEIYFSFFKACIKKGDVNNKMMSALLTGVSRAFPYSKLQALTLKNHMEVFYKLIHFVSFNIAILAMCLIFNVLDTNESGFLSDRFYSVLYRQLLDTQLENCSRKAMFLNLIYRTMKRDPIISRVGTFIKRLLQMAINYPPPLTCSILILIAELTKTRPEVWNCLQLNSVISNFENGNDEEEEYYGDVKEDCDDENKSFKETFEKIKSTESSWVHSSNHGKGVEDDNKKCSKSYDPLSRNPLYTHNEKVTLWELPSIMKHYHPSVILFGEKLMEKNVAGYEGDPLADFTLKHFLDKFVFKNPKKITRQQNLSSRQKTVFGRLNTNKGKGFSGTLKELANQPELKIPVEERFIHKYLSDKEKEEENSDLESVTSEDFERILEKFEPGFEKEDLNFAKDIKKGKKKLRKMEKKKEEDEDSDEFDMNDDDDEDIDFEEDEEYQEAFKDFDDEIEDALDDDDVIPAKHIRKGRDSGIASLFASADEFAEILEANDDDEDNDGSENDFNVNVNHTKRKKSSFSTKKRHKKV